VRRSCSRLRRLQWSAAQAGQVAPSRRPRSAIWVQSFKVSTCGRCCARQPLGALAPALPAAGPPCQPRHYHSHGAAAAGPQAGPGRAPAAAAAASFTGKRPPPPGPAGAWELQGGTALSLGAARGAILGSRYWRQRRQLAVGGKLRLAAPGPGRRRRGRWAECPCHGGAPSRRDSEAGGRGGQAQPIFHVAAASAAVRRPSFIRLGSLSS
jgi:hypothetical protein